MVADKDRFSFARILQLFVPIAGVSIALISFIFALSSRKKELTLAYLGSENVVSPEAGGVHADIKIDFQGQNIRSLVKMRFAVRNTGGGAIKAEDVKEPIQLLFPKDVKLLSTFLEKTAPSEFDFRPRLMSEQNTILCDFPLLNSGDEAYFSSYLYDSQPKKPQLKGRIVDVRIIHYVDESQAQALDPFPFLSSRTPRKVLYWVMLFLNSALALLFLGLIIGPSVGFGKQLLWSRKWMPSLLEVISEVKKEPTLNLKDLGPEAKALYESQMIRWGTMFLDMPTERRVAALNKAAEKQIPPRPDSLFSTWKEFLQGMLVFFGFFALFAVTSVFIYNSPRSY